MPLANLIRARFSLIKGYALSFVRTRNFYCPGTGDSEPEGFD